MLDDDSKGLRPGSLENRGEIFNDHSRVFEKNFFFYFTFSLIIQDTINFMFENNNLIFFVSVATRRDELSAPFSSVSLILCRRTFPGFPDESTLFPLLPPSVASLSIPFSSVSPRVVTPRTFTKDPG